MSINAIFRPRRLLRSVQYRSVPCWHGQHDAKGSLPVPHRVSLVCHDLNQELDTHWLRPLQ
jgi:hypothetical protein